MPTVSEQKASQSPHATADKVRADRDRSQISDNRIRPHEFLSYQQVRSRLLLLLAIRFRSLQNTVSFFSLKTAHLRQKNCNFFSVEHHEHGCFRSGVIYTDRFIYIEQRLKKIFVSLCNVRPICHVGLSSSAVKPHSIDTDILADSPDTLTSLRGSSRGCRCRCRGMRP